MADILDEASEVEQAYKDQAIANTVSKIKPEKHPDFDGVHCLDCHEPMVSFRLSIGRIRCVDCQTLIERRA